MTRYYEVTLMTKKRYRKVSYVADAFSVDDNRILKIYSKEFGDVFVQIEKDEELSINEIVLKDECDDMIDCYREGEA